MSSSRIPRAEYDRAAVAAAVDQLRLALRGLIDVAEVEDAQLVSLTALARLIFGETHRLYAAAALHRSAAWLWRIETAIATATRLVRSAAADVSLEALARAAAGGGRAA